MPQMPMGYDPRLMNGMGPPTGINPMNSPDVQAPLRPMPPQQMPPGALSNADREYMQSTLPRPSPMAAAVQDLKQFMPFSGAPMAPQKMPFSGAPMQAKKMPYGGPGMGGMTPPPGAISNGDRAFLASIPPGNMMKRPMGQGGAMGKNPNRMKLLQAMMQKRQQTPRPPGG